MVRFPKEEMVIQQLGRVLIIPFLFFIGCANFGSEQDENSTISVPTNLTFTIENGDVTLRWTPVSGITSYALYWANTPNVNGSSNRILIASGSEYTHTQLTKGMTYYYAIAAVDGTGKESAQSSVVTVQLKVTPIPLNVKVVSGVNQNTVSWASVVQGCLVLASV